MATPPFGPVRAKRKKIPLLPRKWLQGSCKKLPRKITAAAILGAQLRFRKKYDTPFREFYAAATGKRVSGSHA
jgi:hypothetical protein